MKILSKYKDYYDFQVGVYGEDPGLLLDRRNGNAKIVLNEDTVVTIFIGNKVVQGIHKENRFYWGKEIEPFSTESNSAKWYLKFSGNGKFVFDFDRDGKQIRQTIFHVELEDIDNNLKLEYEKYCKDYPLSLLIQNVGVLPYPKLESIGVNKIIDPKIVWQEIANYLSSRKQATEKDVPIGSDNIRIEAHGFDLKTSFRKSK